MRRPEVRRGWTRARRLSQYQLLVCVSGEAWNCLLSIGFMRTIDALMTIAYSYGVVLWVARRCLVPLDLTAWVSHLSWFCFILQF